MRTLQEAMYFSRKELNKSIDVLSKYASLILHSSIVSSTHEAAYKDEFSNYTELLDITRELSIKLDEGANKISEKRPHVSPIDSKTKNESIPAHAHVPLPPRFQSVNYPYLEKLMLSSKPSIAPLPAQSSNTIGNILKRLFKFQDLQQCKSANTKAVYYMSVKDIRSAISKDDLLKSKIPKASGMKKEDICKRLMELKSLS